MFVLREKLEDKVDDQKGGGSADDTKTMQPGPGETSDGITGLRAAKVDDKGDDIKDDKVDDKDDEKTGDKTDKADKKDDKVDDKVDDKKDDEIRGIPKSRLDAALTRARDAEKELREVRAKQAGEPVAKAPAKDDDDDDTLTIAQAEKRVSDLDVEIAKAMRDEEEEGHAKLAGLIREQRELAEGIRDAQMEDYQSENRARTTEDIQFDRVVDELESQISRLNPDHKDYDEDLVNETVTLAQALNGQGRTQADSMLLAVDYMSTRLGIDKDVVKDVKKGTDIEKNVKLAAKLPPDLTEAKGVASDKAGVTKDSGKISDMSPEEFEVLTNDEDRLKLLRGDTL